jgi:hypothetical protein
MAQGLIKEHDVSLHQDEAEEVLTRLLRWSLRETIREQKLSLPTNRKMRILTQPKDPMTRTGTSVDQDAARRLHLNPLDAPTKRLWAKLYWDAPTKRWRVSALPGHPDEAAMGETLPSEVPVSAFHRAVDVNRAPVGGGNDEPPSPRGEGRGDVGSGSRYDQLNRERWGPRV